MSSESFNLLLGQFLNRADMTIPRLSKRTGIPVSTIKKWFKNKTPSRPQWRTVLRVARALDLSQEETDQLLQTLRRKSSISQLKRIVTDRDDQALLGHWRGPFLAPARPELLIGRDDILAQIKKVLLDGSAERICVLRGMGGVGKTTLCAEIAHELDQQFADGVLWATLPAETTTDVALRDQLHLFANLLGKTLPPHLSLQALSEHVRHLLTGRDTLLILDNVTSRQQIDYFRPPAWQGALLIATQHTDLRLPLATPDPLEIPPFAPDSDAALDLLVAMFGHERVARERALFLAMIEQVGHLPLALTIIGANLREDPTWTAAEFLEEGLDQLA